MGSPRVGGNSDLLLDQALKGAADDGARTEKIVLNKLLINGCNDCMGCNETGVCVIDDDMQSILPRLREADYIIHSAPVYFWSITAQMKAYLDRWCSFFDGSWRWHKDYFPEMKGKKIGLITVCGDHDTTTCDPIENVFKNLCEFCLLDYKGSVNVSASAKGEISGKGDALEEAYRLGQAGVQT